MKKILLSTAMVLVLLVTLLICSCSSASKSAASALSTAEQSQSVSTSETREKEVLSYAESIGKIINDMAEPLQKLKATFSTVEDFDEHLKAIDEITSLLEEMVKIEAPDGYKEMQENLSDAALKLYGFYNLEKGASKMCQKSLDFAIFKYEGVLDLYSVLLNKAETMELTPEEEDYLDKINEIMSQEYDGVMSYEYIRHLEEIEELTPPENFRTNHNNIVWDVKTLMEYFSSYNFSVSFKDDIIVENYETYSTSMINLIYYYGEITAKIDSEYPEYYN